jgi:hypothetical protein
VSNARWVAPLPPFHTANGTALANSVVLTDISPAPPVVIPAQFLAPGSEIEIRAMGEFSTTGTPTLLIGIYYGGVAGVALAISAAITTASGAAAFPWQLDYRGVVRTDGATGTLNGQGRLYLGTTLAVASVNIIPITQALRTVTIDTTAAKSVTIGAQWGTASASNTITCNDISVKSVT